MGNGRSSMPSQTKVWEYWHPIMYELGRIDNPINVDKCFRQCFACGAFRILERAHIKPICEGGSNDVSNLHLLCKGCHQWSECIPSDKYWIWLKSVDQEAFLHFELKTLNTMAENGFIDINFS